MCMSHLSRFSFSECLCLLCFVVYVCVYVFVVFVYLFVILAGTRIYKDLAELPVCHEGVGGVGGVGEVNPFLRHLRDVAYLYIYIYLLRLRGLLRRRPS